MANYTVVISHVCAYTEVHFVIHNLGLCPLLQFNDDDVVLAVFICSYNDEIYALGSLWNVIFDGNLDLVVNVTVIHDIPHEFHGIVP